MTSKLDKAPSVVYALGMKRRKPKLLSDQLRELVRNCEHSRYAISKATGIDQAVLSHFVAGHRGMSLASLDVLGDFLGLRVVRTRKGR